MSIFANQKNMARDLIKTPIQSDFLPVVVRINRQAEFVKFAIWYGTPGQFRQPPFPPEPGRGKERPRRAGTSSR